MKRTREDLFRGLLEQEELTVRLAPVIPRLDPSAPISDKPKHNKNPKRPGRKPGQGTFRNRSAPSEEDYCEPAIDAPMTETTCPDFGGGLEPAGEEVVTVTDLPEMPKRIVKAYRVRYGEYDSVRAEPSIEDLQHG
jgi:hypothetical protein